MFNPSSPCWDTHKPQALGELPGAFVLGWPQESIPLAEVPMALRHHHILSKTGPKSIAQVQTP